MCTSPYVLSTPFHGRFWLVLLVFGLLISGCRGNGEEEPPEERSVFVFLDVTTGQIETDTTTVKDVTRRIIDTAPYGVKLRISPVVAATERAATVEVTIPLPTKRSKCEDASQARERGKKEAVNMIEDVHAMQKETPKVARSCLLNTVARLNAHVTQEIRDKEGPVRALYVTNMVEECKGTPFGIPVFLTEEKIGQAEAALDTVEANNINLERLDKLIFVRLTSQDVATNSDLQNRRSRYWERVFTDIYNLSGDRLYLPPESNREVAPVLLYREWGMEDDPCQ